MSNIPFRLTIRPDVNLIACARYSTEVLPDSVAASRGRNFAPGTIHSLIIEIPKILMRSITDAAVIFARLLPCGADAPGLAGGLDGDDNRARP